MPRLLLLLTALTCSIAVAACGSDGSSSSSSAATELVPAASLVYAEATLRPEGEQKEAIDALVSKFPGEGTAGERLRRLFDEATKQEDSELSYSEDIEPWLGDDAAFFVGVPKGDTAPAAAAMVATEDEDATIAALEKDEQDARKVEHRGQEMYVFGDDSAGAVLDGWLVLGNEAGVKAAIDTAEGGRPIGDDQTFEDTLADAADDRLGLVYVNSPAMLEQLQSTPMAGQLGQFRELFSQPTLATFDADENGIRAEGTVPMQAMAGLPFVGEGSDMVEELPAESWLAMAQPELGKTLEWYADMAAGAIGGRDVLAQQLKAATGLDLDRDVLSWMGDWGLFARGSSLLNVDGALIVETSDEAASARFIDAIAGLARANTSGGERVVPLRVPGEGVTLLTDDVPRPIHLFQRDGRVVLAFGDAAAADAIDPGETLGDSAEFAEAKEALGGDYTLSMYLSIAPVLELAQSAGAASDEEFQKALPYLEPLGALVAGATEDGDEIRSAFGLTVK